MMYRFIRHGFFIAIMMLYAQMSMAQFTASGTVNDAEGEPMPGVAVIIKGTALGVFTDMDGAFKVNVPTNSATLLFNFIGYSNVEQEVSSSNGTISVVMEESTSTLDEVIVTGLATSVKRSNLANSVEVVKADQLVGTTTQSTMDGALYGKFKGAEIKANSGAPGGGMSIRMRGVTSIFGDQQPLYIVDGIYVDNSTISLGTNVVTAAAGGGNTSTNQDDASNRIADIDPEDIESIELLKGASAAAIYGSRAAGGVVIITTKKGTTGKTKVTLAQTFGTISPTRLLGPRSFDAAKVAANFTQNDVDLFNQNGLRDYEAELYDHTRFANNTRLNISGGNEKTNFFIGSTYKNENGLVENTGYEKVAARINLGHKFNDWLEVDLTSNYINSISDRGLFNNGNNNNTVGYALAFTKPWLDLSPDADGVYPAVPSVGSNVLETVNLVTNREKINRFIGGGTGKIRLYQDTKNNLKLVLRGGLDQYTLRSTGLFPQALSFYRNPGTLGGASISGTTVNLNTNLAAFLVFSHYTDGGLTLRTSLGATAEDFNQNTVITTATGLNGSQTNIDQAANVAGFQNRIIQHDRGFFAQEEVNFRDQIIATIGIRADKSTNNGDANQLYYYPKANLALNLHEFDFWSVDLINQLKLRVAYGQSGRFARFNNRFTAFQGNVIGGNSGLQQVPLRGNPTVGPERQTEIEFGTDISLLNNKVNLDVNYYIKNIDDLLLNANIPTSTGWTAQVLNAGALQNRGFEIGLGINPVTTKDFSWSTRFSFWKNQSEVTRLDVPAFNLGGFAASLGQYRIQEGESATQLVGTFDRADCGTPECLDLDPDGDGFRVYGNAEPDFNLSFTNNLNYKGLELAFLFHWKKGGDAINLSTFLYDLAGLTWDYDDAGLDPSGTLTNGPYRLSVNGAGPWIEDAGYLRLREIGLHYTIPKSVFNDMLRLKVGVSGRNLINIFDYNSYDPEVSNFGNNVLANSVEVTPFPASKRMNFHITAFF